MDNSELSVTDKQIQEKAPQLLKLYLESAKQESNPEDETQLLICEDMLFYCCAHLTAEDFTHPKDVAEELYMVGFLFWGSTEQGILPFRKLPENLQQTYILLVKQIQLWIAEDALPSAQPHGSA